MVVFIAVYIYIFLFSNQLIIVMGSADQCGPIISIKLVIYNFTTFTFTNKIKERTHNPKVIAIFVTKSVPKKRTSLDIYTNDDDAMIHPPNLLHSIFKILYRTTIQYESGFKT